MKCKYCGAEFKFKPRKLFCNATCKDNFNYRKGRKKVKKCVACGKDLDFKYAQKYCSKECHNEKRRNDHAKKILKLEKENLRKIARNLKQANYYLKDFNPNIEICLNCKNDTCEGECELINSYIRG